MRALKSHFVVLAEGDVAGLSVIHFANAVRLVIHDRDSEAPLIQVLLSESERQALIAALGDTMPSVCRRPFRAPRTARRFRPEVL